MKKNTKDASLSKQITARVMEAKNNHLAAKDLVLLEIQAYFLAHKDNDLQNVFHKACFQGNLELLKFIHEKAGPRYLNILEFVVDAVDVDGLTPLYYLCMRGYREKKDIELNKAIKNRVQMIEVLCPAKKFD